MVERSGEWFERKLRDRCLESYSTCLQVLQNPVDIVVKFHESMGPVPFASSLELTQLYSSPYHDGRQYSLCRTRPLKRSRNQLSFF